MVLTKSLLSQCLKNSRKGVFDRVLESAQVWHCEAAKQGRLFLQDMSTYPYLSIPEIQILHLACDFSCYLSFSITAKKVDCMEDWSVSGYNSQVLVQDISNPLVREGVLKSISVMYCSSHLFLKYLILAGIKMLKTC